MRDEIKPVEYLVLILIVIISIMVIFQLTNTDINFCRRVFGSLISGRHSAQKFIDWEQLTALGINVGTTYKNIPLESLKSGYKEAFIRNFSAGFKKSGGKLSSFTNWRLYNKSAGTMVIAADYPSKKMTLLFTLSAGARKKLIAIQWKDEKRE